MDDLCSIMEGWVGPPARGLDALGFGWFAGPIWLEGLKCMLGLGPGFGLGFGPSILNTVLTLLNSSLAAISWALI